MEYKIIVINGGFIVPTFLDTARYVKELTDEEFILLKKTLHLSKKYERVDLRVLKAKLPFSEKLFQKLIKKLSKRGFITYYEQPYESIILNSSGLDLIALKKLADRDIVVGVGRQIGVGKEADIYEAIDAYGNRISIKIYRLGRVSFRKIVKRRNYADIQSTYKWFKRNRISAKREFRVLRHLYLHNVSVPRPIFLTMHMIVMEELDGALLQKIYSLPDPLETYKAIISEVHKALKAGYINSDLSEYNIFIRNSDGYPVLIDWPQAIEFEKENALYNLRKDVENLIKFFNKRFYINKEKLYKIAAERLPLK